MKWQVIIYFEMKKIIIFEIHKIQLKNLLGINILLLNNYLKV